MNNLINIIDYNKFSYPVSIEGGMSLEPLADKWRAFGWWVTEVDGHNFREIIETLEKVDKIST